MKTQATPAAARKITVAPERLPGWLERFTARHGVLNWEICADFAAATAEDGACAKCLIPYPPLANGMSITDHALIERVIGVGLVRLGGYAAGIFEGKKLVASKCGSRLVHGRSAAGGSSQQRFARRRENQAKVALDAAVAAVARVLLPEVSRLDAIVLGGDRRAVETVFSDPQFQSLRALIQQPFLDVPDPRHAVLLKAGTMARAVQIQVTDPG